MDPQATWDEMLDAFVSQEWDTAGERADDLLTWLQRNGFPPVTVVDSDHGNHCRALNLLVARVVCEHLRDIHPPT